MTQPRSQLPSIGPPIQTWGSSRKCTDPLQRRKDKVSLWSAVALQQHFTANGVLSAATLDGQDGSVSREGVPLNMQTNEAPPPRPNGRLTLAQKMGLVPTPPRAPTDDDWKAVEQRAILREEQQTLGAHVCGICYETFASTMDQGQLILSCTHVFHERCFRQFERFVRAQQRADGNTFYTRLACPECREVHFHKRMYFAGKAMAQRAAIIKIQALIRGALARRAYCKLRLRQDEAFRSAYVSHRLAKLSAAWEAFLNRQDRDRDVLLTEISVRQQAAAAAALTEDGWESIIHRRRLADRITALPSDEVEGTLPFTSTHGDHDKNQTWVEKHECAICLEAIQRDLPSGRWSQNARSWLPQPTTLGALALGDDTRSPPDGNNESDPIKLSGEAYVLLVRQKYEEKKKAEADERRRQKKKTTGHQRRGSSNSELPSMRSTLRFSMVSKSIPSLSHDRGGQKPSSTASTSAKKPSQPVVPTPAKEGEDQVQTAGPARVLPRNGTILSCGHCFHEACLSTFERYTMWRSTDESSPIVAFRCPLCRSGYARHPF